MINLHLNLNTAKKLASDIDRLIALTQGHYMSLGLLRSELLRSLNQFVDSDSKKYRIVSYIGDTNLTTEPLSFEDARSEYFHWCDLHPENHYEILEDTV